MQGLFVDIGNELADIDTEVRMLRNGISVYRSLAEPDPVWTWLAVQGLASGVEKIYTGCERVMAMVARGIDGSRIDHDEGWHHALLKRMGHPYPGIRNAVISAECYVALDRLRAFRHRERNSYGLALDKEIVLERAAETVAAFATFRSELDTFAREHQSSIPAAGDA